MKKESERPTHMEFPPSIFCFKGNSTVLFFYESISRNLLVGDLLYYVTETSHLMVQFSHCAVPISHVTVFLLHSVVPLFISHLIVALLH